jgi:hypothetical protein
LSQFSLSLPRVKLAANFVQASIVQPRCLRLLCTAIFAASASLALAQTPVSNVSNNIEQSVANVAAELKQACPLADPSSQSAFDRCRQTFFDNSLIKQMMGSVVLWGRQRDPKLTIKDSSLTQFAPDIVAGMYMPLFMFDGKYTLVYHEQEKLYLATLGVAFRNRLQPGQFPYPFWHDEKKWDGYQDANVMLLWIDPANSKIKVAQFAPTGKTMEGYASSKVAPAAHDGKWLWTDAQGKTQPAVTLFDGLYRDNNPYKEKLDLTYRDFAITLRESQCLNCHVPNNPDKMKRLVLMQTPAHASMEIQRILKSVREKKMPLDDQNIEKTLDPQLEKVLLEKGGAFEAVVNAAREWESKQAVR